MGTIVVTQVCQEADLATNIELVCDK